MSQEDYDQGYDDGRKSRDEEVASLKQQLGWTRGDLESEREECKRLRSIVHRPVVWTDSVPF